MKITGETETEIKNGNEIKALEERIETIQAIILPYQIELDALEKKLSELLQENHCKECDDFDCENSKVFKEIHQ